MSAQRKLSFGKRGHANRTKDGHNHSSLPPTARQAGRKRGSLQRLPQRPAVMAAQRLCRHAAIALPPLCCQSAVTLSPFVGIGQEPDKSRTGSGQEPDRNRTGSGQKPDKSQTRSGQEADRKRTRAGSIPVSGETFGEEKALSVPDGRCPSSAGDAEEAGVTSSPSATPTRNGSAGTPSCRHTPVEAGAGLASRRR